MRLRIIVALILAWSPAPPGILAAQLPLPLVERNEARIVHPEPRLLVTASRVVRDLPSDASVLARLAYETATEIPHVLDGIHSYCHAGRSLLSCFESHEG